LKQVWRQDVQKYMGAIEKGHSVAHATISGKAEWRSGQTGNWTNLRDLLSARPL
jgi:hypothetical protein